MKRKFLYNFNFQREIEERIENFGEDIGERKERRDTKC